LTAWIRAEVRRFTTPVIAAATHLATGARREKKVLLAVTDGEDNESNRSLEQAIRAVQDDNGRWFTPSASWARKAASVAPSAR